MSISSITQPRVYSNNATTSRGSTQARTADASGTPPKPASTSSSGATPAGSTALFRQLTNDVQSLLLQEQGGYGSAPISAAAATTYASTNATTFTSGATIDPYAATDGAKWPNHPNLSGQETGAPAQSPDPAATDLNGMMISSAAAAGSIVTATAGQSPNTISAGLFGAFRAYASANAQYLNPIQFGSV